MGLPLLDRERKCEREQEGGTLRVKQEPRVFFFKDIAVAKVTCTGTTELRCQCSTRLKSGSLTKFDPLSLAQVEACAPLMTD